jgi:hypothetical protein
VKRRTQETKKAMTHAIGVAIEFLEHPSIANVDGRHDPRDLARSLHWCARELAKPGKLKAAMKEDIMLDLQLAADYLSCPQVAKQPFALSPLSVARALREIITGLK